MKANWDLTEICNLNCKHCGASDYILQRREVSAEEIVKIVENIAGVVTEVDLLGGEPLLCRGIEVLLNECEEKGILYNIITNGQHDREYIRKLFFNKRMLKTILISIEGLEKENDYIRGKGTFSKAVDFLAQLECLREGAKLNCTIGINMTINRLNAENIVETLRYFIETLKIDIIQVTPMREEGNAIISTEILLEDEELLDCYEKIASFIVENQYEKRINLNYNFLRIPEYLNAKYGLNLGIFEKKCLAGENEIYIDATGVATVCRTCNDGKIDLKKESLTESYDRFTEFIAKKNCRKTNRSLCNCIYKDICNECIYITEQKEPIICRIIEERMKKEKLDERIEFQIEKPCCLFEDTDTDFYGGYYPGSKERVEYEKIGFNILKLIYSNSLTAAEIGEKLGINKTLVFEFLIQEQSKNHIRQTKVR